MKILLFAFCVLLQSCATESGYKKMAASWVGQTTGELYEKWGYPKGSFDKDGNKVLIYPWAKSALIENGDQPFMHNTNCTTYFETKEEKILKVSWEGNNCRR